MEVTCGQCGEELLGAVNRCWRCGAKIPAHPGDMQTPPIRRDPIPLPEIEEASPRDGEAIVVAALADDAPQQPAGDHSDEPIVARRVGSPFAPDSSAPPAATYIPVSQPNYSQNSTARGGAWAGLFLALLSFSLSFTGTTALAALPLAVFGLLMGIWGLYARRRTIAIVAVLLCCLSMAISGFNCAVISYEMVNGVSPWESNQPYDPLDDPAYMNGEFNQSLEP